MFKRGREKIIPRDSLSFLSGAGLKGACLCKGRKGNEKSSFYRTFQGGEGEGRQHSPAEDHLSRKWMRLREPKGKGGGGVRRTGTGFDRTK